MKPLNQAERQKAFMRFLLFFVITIAVILTTVFFSVAVPFRQNDELNRQMALIDQEKKFADSFNIIMMNTIQLLEDVNKPGNEIVYEARIKINLLNMTSMTNGSDTANNIYISIVRTLSNLESSKEQLRDALAKDQTVSDYIQKITDLRSELTQCESTKSQYLQLLQNKK